MRNRELLAHGPIHDRGSCRVVIIGLCLSLAGGCGDKKTQPAEPANAPGAQQSAPQKPVEAAKPSAAPAVKPATSVPAKPAAKEPEKSTVDQGKEALKAAAGTKAQVVALKGIRTYVDTHPRADDLVATCRFLAAECVERAVAALETSGQHTANKLIEPIMNGKGGLDEAIGSALGVEREPLAKFASYLYGGDLDGLHIAVALAKGQSKIAPAAARLVKARLARPLKAFAETDPQKRAEAILAVYARGDWVKCPEARGGSKRPQDVCKPGFYGLGDKASLAGLDDKALQILRLAEIAKAAGDAAPKGLVALPSPKTRALDLPQTRGEVATVEPLEVITVTPEGVYATLRPVAKLGEPKLVSGGAWPGKLVVSTAQLDAVDVAHVETLQPLVEALRSLRAQAAAAEKVVFADRRSATNGAQHPTAFAASVVVEGAVDTKRLKALLRGMESAGYTDPRYVRGKSLDAVLPAPQAVATIPEAHRGRVEKRALLVHVTAVGMDVWPAVGGEGEAPKEATPAALPAKAKPWYRGTRIAKYRLSTPDLGTLVQTVRALRQKHGSGTVVLVVPDDEVPAARALAVTNALADVEGTPQTQLGEVFFGMACQDEDPSAAGRCRSVFPVLLPTVEVPSSRGLTEAPKRREVKPKPEPKKPAPKPEPPAAEKCDYKYIRKVVRSRSGKYRFCYERVLQAKHGLQGKATFTLDISGAGTVLKVSGAGNMDAKVTDCVVKSMKKLKFKPMIGGTTCHLKHRITFKPD